MPFSATISVDAPLEAAAPAAGKPAELGHVLAPVIAYGEKIAGNVLLTGPAEGAFTGLTMQLHCFASRKAAGDKAWVSHVIKTTAVVVELKGDATFTLDASGNVRFPFSAGMMQQPLIAGLAIPDKLCVQHELELTFKPLKGRAVRITQPLCVQTLTSAPVPRALERPWMTVNDFGGECKVELCNQGTTWPLDGKLEAEVTLVNTSALKEVKLVLQAGVNGADAESCLEQVVWSAKSDAGETPSLKSQKVVLDLAAAVKVDVAAVGAGLCPSIEEVMAEGALGPVGVFHSIKLQLTAPDNLAGWNTMPIVLASGTALHGDKAGSLAPPAPIKKKLARPPPYTPPSYRWLKVLLALFLSTLTAGGLAAEAGLAYLDGRQPLVSPVLEATGVRAPLVAYIREQGILQALDNYQVAQRKKEEEEETKLGKKASKSERVKSKARERLDARAEREKKHAKPGAKKKGKKASNFDAAEQVDLDAGAATMSDEEREFLEVMRPTIENITNAEKFDFDALSDMMDEMGEAQVRMMMKALQLTFNGTSDAWDIDEARDHCVNQIMMLAQRQFFQKQKALNHKDKMEVALKKKPIQQIKDMLDDCELPFEETATSTELREYALRVDLLDKYDRLPGDFKLQKNRARALAGAQRYEEKKAYERAKADYEKKQKEAADDAKYGPMHNNEMFKTYHPWEVEWDQEMEIEALERLQQLPLWNTMTPEMLDNFMARVRQNPKVLDMIEGETRSLQSLRDQFGPNGEMPSMDVMRQAGMDLKYSDLQGKGDKTAAAVSGMASAA